MRLSIKDFHLIVVGEKMLEGLCIVWFCPVLPTRLVEEEEELWSLCNYIWWMALGRTIIYCTVSGI